MDELSPRELEKRLATRLLGRRAVVLDTVDSTNLEVRRRLEAEPDGGLAVIAEEQTGGRGRRGRAWVSRRGCGLWMTAAVKPEVPAGELQRMTLLTGLAVCRAVVQATNGAVRPEIKWPNDVLALRRKLCGILSETVTASSGEQYVVIGVGVNTKTPPEGWGAAEAVAVSLEQAAGAAPPRMLLAALILNHMECLLDAWRNEGFRPVAEGYREFMLPPGSAVEVMDGGTRRPGRIEGLDDGGALLVRLENGERMTIISGEISLRSVEGYA